MGKFLFFWGADSGTFFFKKSFWCPKKDLKNSPFSLLFFQTDCKDHVFPIIRCKRKKVWFFLFFHKNVYMLRHLFTKRQGKKTVRSQLLGKISGIRCLRGGVNYNQKKNKKRFFLLFFCTFFSNFGNLNHFWENWDSCTFQWDLFPRNRVCFCEGYLRTFVNPSFLKKEVVFQCSRDSIFSRFFH